MILWYSNLNLLLLDVILQWYQENIYLEILFLSYGEYHLAEEEMFGSVVPQFCKLAELLQCVGLEMVVQVVEWEWIFEMDMVGVVVVVEVDGRDNMELGMDDIEENLEDILDGSHKFLSNLFSKLGFGVDMAKVAKERVCSNYFEVDVDNLEIIT